MPSRHRARPSHASWPSKADWDALRSQVGGRLLELEPPLAACRTAPEGLACLEALRRLKNPYWLGDQPSLTQASGWLDAWTSTPSAFAVAAAKTGDVVVAVNFAREHNVRLVVKGGGHSYHGASSSADSLLIWTRAMNDVVLHDAFVPDGGAGAIAPGPAVSVGAGAIWVHVYDAVTTRANRYVQGGGCMTVGVAGLIQSGGFGSFSKGFGLAAAGLLQAEVVTADGETRTANAFTHPDLFWALKGGGGGTFGVVTRVTLGTRELPPTLGVVFGTVQAHSAVAFRRLTGRVVSFYRERLFNPHWGEQIHFEPNDSVGIGMVFQGLSRQQAEEAWRPFLDWVAEAPQDFSWSTPLTIEELPARHFWDVAFLSEIAPARILADDRPDAQQGSFLWAGNLGEAGQFLHAYYSAWLPASLLEDNQQPSLVEALFAGGAVRDLLLGLEEELLADQFLGQEALGRGGVLVLGVERWPGGERRHHRVEDHAHVLARASARRDAEAVRRASDEVSRLVPTPGSYVSESDFFIADWQEAFWGSNYPRLVAVKRKYDPTGLFFAHHGVGSEEWEADGFTRVAENDAG